MIANMHYKRFPTNVTSVGDVNVLKTAVLFGANNTGKTKFVHAVAMMKAIMLNQSPSIVPNIFGNNTVIESSISFLENGKEYVLDVKYDKKHDEYIYECFSEVYRDKHKNKRYKTLLLRDIQKRQYEAEDKKLIPVMSVAARNNLLIYLIDTESFSLLHDIKAIIRTFASKIDIVDMNNIPINKTIEMMKMSNNDSHSITEFVLKADLSLDNFKYATDEEVKIVINTGEITPQEKALLFAASLQDMLHLVSTYKNKPVPSIMFDSTGTKKMIALASYVVDALKNGRILVVDELDNSLHFRLTRAIISLFNNELNEKAQLIVTAHDISLLDCHTLFRKEQIWFTHKGKDRAYLYSLSAFTASEKKVRNTSDLVAKYRAGVFGALPEPDLFDMLLKIRES